MSIASKIEQYKQEIIDRWHTPGHKGLLWADDITEIDDGERFPSSEVLSAEKSVAAFYNAKHLRFLNGGSSMGVKAAVLAVDGDIIVFEGAHRSVYEAAQLSKVNVIKIDLGKSESLFNQPTLDDIEKACKTYKNAKAICITSPDYFGRTVPIEAVSIAHSNNMALIADSAHGAHFPLIDSIKDKSFAHCADFCNLSAHKTLSAMTMGAYLCVNNESFIEKADTALKNLGTTSPLYPLYASLESAPILASLAKHNYDYIQRFSCELAEQIPLLKTDDFTRITVDCKKLCNKSGKELFDILYKDHQIAAEMYFKQYLVFIATHCDDEKKLFRLRYALLDAKTAKDDFLNVEG